jgi:hypothetical protein
MRTDNKVTLAIEDLELLNLHVPAELITRIQLAYDLRSGY